MARKGRESWGAALLAGLPWTGLVVLWLRFNMPPGRPTREGLRLASGGDLFNYYFGMAELTGRRLAAGELPLWNPHACSGIPLLASGQAAVFYPGTWLSLALPPERALPFLAFVQCALAGWLAALFFRARGAGAWAAGVGGTLFLFACVLGETPWPPVVSTILWLPWLLLCVERFARSGARRWWAGLAAGAALQILAGFPQYVAYSWLLVAPYALVRLLEEHRRAPERADALRRSAALAAGLALGAALAAVQLLPTLELVRGSARSQALTAEEVHYLSLLRAHPVADVLRRALDPSPKLVAFDFGTGGGFLGTATPIALVLGIAAAWRRAGTWLLLAVGGFALLLSDGYLGAAAPLYEAFAALPLVGSFRTPERLRLLAFFCAIALSVAGFDRLARPADAAAVRRRRAALALAAGAALAAGMAATGSGAHIWRALLATAAAGGLALWPERGRRRAAAVGLCSVLLLADLVSATARVGSFRSMPAQLARAFRSPGGSPLPDAFLARQRSAAAPGRMALLRLWPHVAAAPAAGIDRISCSEPLVPSQWELLGERLRGRPSRGTHVADVDPAAFPALYDVTSVRRILAADPDGAGVAVVSNDDALPRAYWVEDFAVVPQAAAFDHIAAGDLDFHRTVLLEHPPPGLTRPSRAAPARPARVTSRAPERVAVEVEAPRPGLLVLTDTHYPGWEARLDGEAAPILRANGLVRAVAVPAGRHEVVFRYRPASLRHGAWISLAAAAVLAASVRPRPRRSPRPPQPGP